jgi:ABC-2 type transport system permease protein
MNATLSIMRRELGAYFNTPIGYVIIVAFLLITCAIYVNQLFVIGMAEIRAYLGLMPFFMMLFVPAISMRLWAEERKLGTMELLMTMPLKTWHAVLGKFLAGLAFIIIMMCLTLHLPLTLYILGNPDTGTVIGGYLGTLVLAMVYLSIGSFASSLTSDQIVAFIIGLSINFLFFLMGYRQVLDAIKDFSPEVSAVVERFGVDFHFESISRGVVDSRDIVYALSITGLFLFLNVMVIERRR